MKRGWLSILLALLITMMMSSIAFAVVEEDELPELCDHNISNEWSYNSSYHWHACINCGAEFDKTVHSWNSGVITTEPTSTTTGVKTFTCTVCGATKTEGLLRVNPLKLSTSKKTYKAKTVKKSKKTFNVKVTKFKGKTSYSLDDAAKAAKIKVKKAGSNSKTVKYKVTVPKKCKAGTYIVTINAAGNDSYQAGSKAIKIVVK